MSVIGESNNPEKRISSDLFDFIESGITTKRIKLEDFIDGEIDERSIIFVFQVQDIHYPSEQYRRERSASSTFEYRFDTKELYYPDEVEYN